MSKAKGNPTAATRCNKIKKDGNRCGAPAMPNGKCRVHGGAVPKGPATGAYKHGRYSKYAPPGLSQRMQQAEHDPELTSNRAELALLTARIQELLSASAKQDASSDTWTELYQAVEIRRKVNDSERKRMIDLNQYVPVEQVFVLLGQVYDVIAEHVTDRRTLAAIGQSFRVLTGADGLRAPLPGSRKRQPVPEVSDFSELAPGS